MMSEDAAHEESLVLALAPSHPGHGDFVLRVSSEYEPELAELLRREGIYGGRIMEFSTSATLLEVLSVAVGTGGALTALADALTTFLKPHEGKQLTLRSEAGEVTAKGYSRRDVEQLIDSTAELQLRWDQQFRDLQARPAEDRESRSQQDDHHGT